MEDLESDGTRYIHTITGWRRSLLNLTEAKALLNYRDIRSVLKWCEDNDVFVIEQGNTKVVNLAEFILAFYKPFILHLKHSKENWKELLMSYVCADMTELIDDGTSIRRLKNPAPKKSDIESSFIKKMRGL